MRHYRSLIRIEYLDDELAILWVPSWNPHVAVVYRPPPAGLLEYRGDNYVFGWACIGAETSRDLDPTGPWEKAPEPIRDEELFEL